MHGLDLVNTAIFVGAALVMLGIFSSLIATRAGAPLLLVFLVVGMLAGQDGPGGIVFNDYSLTYLVGMIALSIVLFDGGLRTRLAAFRGVLAPSLLLATVGVIVTASVVGAVGWLVLDLDPGGALLLGTIIASTDAAAVFFLLRTGGLRLQHRVGATLEIESGTNDPIAVFLVIILTQLILAGGHTPASELAMELVMEAVLGAAFGLAGGFALVAMLNGLAMPGGLHPLFVVAGAVTISAVTSLVGGSGLLAVYIAGLVMANRPVRAYPSIVGFHDAVTWLCQIVMFLMLGLLVTPSTLWDYAPQGLLVAAALTLVARPLAVWICTWGSGFGLREKVFISWVGLRGAVSIFLATIPMLAGVPNATAYFNIAFFVVLVSMLVQGSTLTTAARRLGVALKQLTHGVSRVEIDIPGQTEQEIVGYPVTADSVILGLNRLPGWARVVMVVRKGHDPRRARRPGRSSRATTAISWSAATACPGSIPCSARAPTWRAGSGSSSASFRSAARRGWRRSKSSTASSSARTCRRPRSPSGPRRASAAGRCSTPRSRFPRASWSSAASSRAGSPASACSSTSCCRSSPTRSSSSGSRPRPTSSVVCGAGWRA